MKALWLGKRARPWDLVLACSAVAYTRQIARFFAFNQLLPVRFGAVGDEVSRNAHHFGRVISYCMCQADHMPTKPQEEPTG